MSVVALSCLQIPSTPIKYAIGSVLSVALIIYVTRPNLFYNSETQEWRNFGTAPEETLFPAWLAMLSAGYLIYMMSCSIRAFERAPL